MRQTKDEKLHARLDQFGVDFDNCDYMELRRRNAAAAKQIAGSLAGSKLYSIGSLFSGNANQTFIMEMLRAQVEQNFILMRQNEELIRLQKLIASRLER